MRRACSGAENTSSASHARGLASKQQFDLGDVSIGRFVQESELLHARSSGVHSDVGTRDLTGVVSSLVVGSSCAKGVRIFFGFCVW